MSYATLMVHLELGRSNAALLKIAGDLAERLQAAVIGIAACQPIRIIYNDGYVPAEVIEQDRQEIDDEIKAAEAEFHTALDGRIAALEWRSATTYASLSEYLAQEARCADLIITGVDRDASIFDRSRHVDIGDFVMQAGRPCLIVPAATESLGLDHVVVGWKDSTETRRAICDALPLLKQAGRVTVVEVAVEEDLDAARARLGDVVAWLKRHGVVAGSVASPSTGDDAAQLNAIVREHGADLLVAGAYGHSRLREWVLGGVTRDLLLRADRCSLVSH
ncbi:MAG: universal stress protein [Rhodopila sp.]|nr:universal stress protein [Rhodopila sp.]